MTPRTPRLIRWSLTSVAAALPIALVAPWQAQAGPEPVVSITSVSTVRPLAGSVPVSTGLAAGAAATQRLAGMDDQADVLGADAGADPEPDPAAKGRNNERHRKLRDAPYRIGARSSDWQKIKCVKRQEFVVGGFTDPSGSRIGVGSILVGYYERGSLRFAGKVGTGTGWSNKFSLDLRRQLEKSEIDQTPFDPVPPGWLRKNAHWVKPTLVAEVEFSEWTSDGRVRHPSLKGFRTDKAPRDVGREDPLVALLDRGPADKVLHDKPNGRAPGTPEDKARSHFVGDAEQIELTAQLAVIAPPRLLELPQIVL